MKNKIKKQIYCFIFFNIYHIYNTFHVLFLKLYLYCADDAKTKIIMQTSKFLNNTKQ